MKEKQIRKNGKKSLKKSPVFLIALLNFLIIITILIYIIYLRFIPYETITYDGYAVSGKDLVNNLLNSTFDVQENLEALEVKDQDEIYKNIKSYYVGADKTKNINLDYPIYVNDTLALYNLSADTLLYTDTLKPIEGYAGFTLTSGALYNANTLERADYHDYILMKNSDNMYINTKEIKIETANNKYTIKMNSIINFTDEYITYYSLKDKNFVYGKILDIDMDSKVIIKDYNKEYTYKEFLIGLDIIKEDVQEPVEEEPEEVVEKEESKKETPKEENKIIIEKEPENVIEEEPEKPVEEEPVQPDNGNGETKWQKPTVSSTDFVPNVYTATTEISISDPSGAINKAITYTFYKDGEIAFRASALSSGTFKVTKLIPETKYNVVGTYQYKNENGGTIEVKFLDQEFKTLNTKNIKPIDLSFENGQIYSNKIEINNFKITSDITDEAISGVSRAEIVINGTVVPIKTAFLRSALKGKVQNNQITDVIEPNTKYKYEFKFYDTANNEMKLNNNTGATLTSKAVPTAKVKVTNQNVISVELGITLSNQDNVELYNYKYILYDYKGKIVKQEDLTIDTKKLYFDNLNPEEVYRIKVFADYDIEDGNGLQENQEIGSATFTTLSISKLGSLKLDVDYEDKNLKDNSIKFTTKINTIKTDSRLMKILTEVNIEIQDENKQTIKSININEFDELSIDGMINEINNLESNTTYNIIITARAKQGDKEENVNTTYTLKSFTTRKKPVKVNIKNLVVTTKLIDFDVIVDDKDGAGDEYKLDLRDKSDTLIERKTINANELIRCTYEELNEGEEYTLTCYASQYNETNENRNVKSNYEIFAEKYKTEGLGGKLNLIGLTRKHTDGKNLIDAQSYNNWYSKCFDVLNTEYVTDNDNNTTFNINSTARYGKKYDKDNKELTLTSNQCYVYNLKEYIGRKVTMSFSAKVSNNSIADGIYIQKGKELGKNIEKIEGITTSDKAYKFTMNVPEDGYLGFYLSKDSSETLIVKKLQVELGENATEYQDYKYRLEADIDIDFIDQNYITGDKEVDDKYSKYYIKINDIYINDEGYKNDSNKVKNSLSYNIDENNASPTYKFQLLIKVYGREYVLDEISFEYNQDTCYEIKSIGSEEEKSIGSEEEKSIGSEEEFRDIQPYGNYIISTDLNLTEASAASEYTFGNTNIAFYGSIDFNGKKVEKDIYSSAINEEETSYIFYNIAKNAKLKNLVLDIYLDNISKRYDIDVLDGIYPLFLYNNGNIDNIMVNLKGCNENDKRYVTLMGYQNNANIENFIINFEKTLYGSQYLAGVTLYSNGTIQNGYMYGNGIEAIKDIVFYDSRNIAGLVYELQSEGIVQNVYTLAGITINHIGQTYSYAANLVYKVNSGATVRNVYSTKEFKTIYQGNDYEKLLDTNNKEVDYGPNIYTSSGNVQFSYYFTGENYSNNSYNIKQDTTVLNDYNFQDNLLNSNNCNSFNVKKQQYPHLKLNVCMPTQTIISLEEKEPDIMDILSSNIVECDGIDDIYKLTNYNEMQEAYKVNLNKQLKDYDFEDENIHVVQFNVYNPSGKTISKINIDYIGKVDIFYQSYSKKMSTVYAVLSEATTYVDEYNISSVVGENMSEIEKEVIFGENGDLEERKIKVSFVKHIKTAEEWDNIDTNDENGVSGLIQNYKLDIDIDFENSEYTSSISGTFKGTFDGQGHKLSNISTDRCLFERIDTSLENLYVEGFKLNTSSNYVGLIGQIGANSTIDNIHVTDIELISSNTSEVCYMGGIIGYVNSVNGENVTIQNVSVNNLTVNLDKSTSTNNHTIGGIVGYWNNTIDNTLMLENYSYYGIKNSYVQGININTKDTNILAIGGILGYSENNITSEKNKLNIEYCYTTGKIITDRPYAGGIYGKVNDGTSNIQGCYSLTNITGNMTTGNEYIGGIGGYNANTSATKNNLYLGNIYVKKASTTYSRRIVGNQENSKNYNNYGYIDQIINGKKTSELYGATKLLIYDEVFDKYTYIDNEKKDNENLKFGTMYNYDGLANNILPKLYDTRGELLPSQKDNTLENGLKIMSVGFEYNTINTENDSIKVTVEFENIDKLDLKDIGIVFENEDLQLHGIESVTNEINYTTVVLIATPNKYYDTYKLSEIKYKNNNGEERTLDSPMKISMPFYKEIYNAEDWNSKIDTTSAENYKIMNDIDFSDVTDVKTNASIGRLVTKDNQLITIKNATLTFSESSSGLIKEIKTEISNINFENINITANASNVGIIYQVNAPLTNCHFDNIEIKGAGYDYIGLISRCNSGNSIKTVTINNVKVYGKNYVGGLVAYKNSSGNIENVTGTYVYIEATGNYVGGIVGISYGGSIKDVKAYQYSEIGEKLKDETEKEIETSYLVYGNSSVGGCIGYTTSYVETIETKYSIIKSKGYNIGGCVGYINGNEGKKITSDYNSIYSNGYNVGGCIGLSYGNIFDCTSTNNTLIKGTDYVGGCVGRLQVWGGSIAKNIKSEYNEKIEGNYYVGGCIGESESWKDTGIIENIISHNNTILGHSNFVGGCIGDSTIRIRKAKTYYDSKTADTNIIGNYHVGGIVGRSNYNVTNTGISYYSIDGAYTNNANIKGTEYVGGISGVQGGTLYGGAVDKSTIIANKCAGGIAGIYRGSIESSASKISCKTFYLMHSFCTNSEVIANENAGGIAGFFRYGNIQYCYVGNTNVTAENENAGGLVGYLDNENMTSKQYIATIKYNFVANTNGEMVYSNTGTGGIIGTTYKDIYKYEDVEKDEEGNIVRVISTKYYIESNLVVSNIKSPDNYASMGIGKVSSTNALGIEQSSNMAKIFVYKYSRVTKGDSNAQVYLHDDEKKAYNLLTSDDFKEERNEKGEVTKKSAFKDTEKLNFADSIGRFAFADGYFPTLNVLTASSTQTYWDADNLNVTQEKIAIPEDSENNQNSGTQLATLNLTSTMLNLNNELPNVYTYAVDANKINVEFNKTSPYLYFDIKTTDGEVLLERTAITERVYTFKYDFSTDLIITISNLDNWYTETINKDKVQNILDVRDNEYLYILDNNLYSSKREIDGQYLNLYNGKALSTDGNIYDLSTMKVVEKNKEKLKLLDEQMPIAKTNYEDIEVQAFYHCSKVSQENGYTYKDQQIFIKNGTMYLADGELDSIGNAIIIDSYNGKEYETILGTDGKIYDLLTKINYPSNFKNENIIAMTNNVDNNDNIVLVYYSSGRVYGFNYITGEEIYDNNVNTEEISFISYFVNNLNLENALYETNKSSYKEAQKLTEKLEYISINDALNDITEDDTNDDTKEEIINISNKDVKEKYITTYDAKTQDYVVYSTSELLVDSSEKTKSENEKINENDELISYYTNVSTSKTKMKDLGIVIISVILLTIAGSLVVMYKKNNKKK